MLTEKPERVTLRSTEVQRNFRGTLTRSFFTRLYGVDQRRIGSYTPTELG